MPEVYRLEAILDARNDASGEIASFAAELEALEAAIGSIGNEDIDIDVKVNVESAFLQLASLRTEMELLRDETVNVRVDIEGAERVAGLVTALDFLPTRSRTFTLRANVEGIADNIAAIRTELEALTREEWQLKVELDTITAWRDLVLLRGAIEELTSGENDIDVGLDLGPLIAELAAIREVLQGIAQDIRLQVELTGGAETIAALMSIRAAAEAVDNEDVDIDVNVNRNEGLGAFREFFLIRALIPVFNAVFTSLSNIVQGARLAGAGIRAMVTGAEGGLESLGAGLRLVGVGLTTIVGFAAGIAVVVGAMSALAGIAVSIGSILGGLVTIAAGFGAAIAAGVGLAAASFILMGQRIDQNRQAFENLKLQMQGLGDDFKTSFNDASEAAARLATQGIGALRAALPALGQEADEVMESLISSFKEVFESIDPGQLTLFSRALDSVSIIMGDISEAAGRFAIALSNVFTAALPQIQEFARHIEDVMQKFQEWTASDAGQERMKQWFSDVAAAAKDIWNGLKDVGSAIQDLADVKSVKDFGEQFKTAAEGVADFLRAVDKVEDGITQVTDAMDKLTSPKGDWNLGAKLGEILGTDQIGPAVEKFVSDVRTAFEQGGWEEVGEVIKQKLGDAIKQAINDPGGFIGEGGNLQIGKVLSDGVVKDIKATDFGQIGTALKDKLVDAIKNAITDPGGIIGEGGSLQIAEKFSDGLAKDIENADFGKIGESIKTKLTESIKNIEWTDMFSGLTPLWLDGLTAAIDKLDLGKIGESIKTKLSDAIKNIEVGEMFGDMGEKLTQGLGDAIKKIDLGPIGDAIKDRISQALKGLEFGAIFAGIGLGAKIGEALSKLFADVDLGKITDAIKEKLKSAFESAKEAVTGFIDELKEKIKTELDNLTTDVGDFGSKLKEKVETELDKAVEGAKQFGEDLKEAIDEAFEQAASSSGSEFGSKLKEQMSQGLESALEAVDQFGADLENKLQQQFEQATQSATNAMDKIATAVREKLNEAAQAAEESGQRISEAFKSSMDEAVSAVESAMDQMVSAIQSGLDQAVAAAESSSQQIVAAFDSLPSELSAIGANAMQALASSITSNGAAAVAAAADVANRINAEFARIQEVHSPSRVWLWFGQMLMAGLTQGIQSEGERAVSAVGVLGSNLHDAFQQRMNAVRELVRDVMADVRREIDAGGDAIGGAASDAVRLRAAHEAAATGALASSASGARSSQRELIAHMQEQHRRTEENRQRETQRLIEANREQMEDHIERFTRAVVAASAAFTGSRGFKDLLDEALGEMSGHVARGRG